MCIRDSIYSYHRWDGLLAELIDDLNEDEIELFFYSLSAYFSKVTEELQSDVYKRQRLD